MTATIEPVVDAMHQFVGGFHPDNGDDLEAFAADFGRLFTEAGAAIGNLASRLGSDFPVDARVVQAYEEMASTMAALSDLAADAYRVHREVHAKELERIEAPRPGEEMWDVRQ